MEGMEPEGFVALKRLKDKGKEYASKAKWKSLEYECIIGVQSGDWADCS